MGALRNGENLGQKLLDLKEQLEEEKAQRSELQGELKSVLKQLKQDFDVTSIDEAERQIKEYEEELEDMEAAIIEQINEVERLMEGGDE